ncbi:Slp family lipoprotein [Thioalkalivibrio sp. ALJ16]|uniref:Slp family lipoprotein n=1 Tax=Thioalkalivibrio sp. ALJ16 TaxID=1158762 RepID=UPI0006879E45|nr:Slp/YeaY family lipoprotein [Thioalkalivibrio sp. ALJ16]
MKRSRVLIPLLGVLLPFVLAACATGPLEAPADSAGQVEPRAVTADRLPADEQVWGGVIARVDNRADATVIEVVGYPLSRQEPQTRQSTTGRFRLRVEGFADPVDYSSGRRITAVGTVSGVEEGQIGQSDYSFPVLEARSVHLWPLPEPPRSSGGVRFGIGIGIGL